MRLRPLISGVCCCALFAQDQPATFRTDTNLVIVNVTVRDKSGKLVDTLKKEDFALTEDDKAQQIAVFEVEHLTSDVLPPVVVPENARPAQIAQAPKEVQRPPAAAASDNTAASRKDRRLLALYFDFSSMQPPEQLRAQQAALKFLNQQMTSSDLVAILTYSNRLRVLQDFTDDRELLFSEIQGFRLGEASENAVDGSTGADDTDDSGSFTPDETEFNIFNTDLKLIGLETAAKKLAMYPEKKALVYFSSGISRTGVDNESQLRATVNAAVRANVAFYTVDARGLTATPPGGDASTASASGTGIFTGKTQQGLRDKFNTSQETLSTLAEDTGGKALLDSNDLSMGITQAQKDINAYYILGYYSTNGTTDGKYRRIKVRLKSDLTAKLDYRTGYYASKVFQKFTASDKERQLEEALTLGDPFTELPLALEVDYFRVARDKYFVPITARIAGSSIDLAKNQKTDLDFIGQIRDSGGKLIGGVRDGISLKFTEGNASQLSRRQLEYDTGVTLPPGDYKLKFLARENQNGKMGTFEMKFTVPDLSKQSSVRMSSVVWSNQREPLSASVGSAANKKLLEAHPLVENGQKLVPDITRVFRKDQKLYVYFEVYDPGTETSPSVSAELTVFRGKSKAFESAPVRVTKPKSGHPNTLAFEFQMPLANIPPGRYTCQVSVIDEQARKFGYARSPLVVLQ
ncbi:MAG: VWA domain-containing protein [Acidobacteriia bacterium]|nr:VWA domain-containing protein [Terriglobia bacterium]